MSAGQQVDAVYETEKATVGYKCKVQPETLTLTINLVANASSSAATRPDQPRAIMNGSRRSRGVNARKVRLVFTGALPPGYSPDSIITLPCLTKAFFAECQEDATGTYSLLGVDYNMRVLGTVPEYIN